MPPLTTNARFDDIVFLTEGPIDPAARDIARSMVSGLVEVAPRPVLFARVKLRAEESRPDEERVIAQGTLDISGTIVRAQTTAPTPVQAIAALEHRLDRRMRRVRDRRQDAERRPPQTPPGEWRSGDLPTSRPSFFPRPREEREIVRRKSFAPDELSVEEALFDLDVLDHRFLLFRDQADGEDSIVFESGDEVLLRRVSGGTPPPRSERPLPVEVDPTPAPEMSEDEAISSLEAAGPEQDHFYFRNAATNRGTAVYRRYDGHYGLVEPAGEDSDR